MDQPPPPDINGRAAPEIPPGLPYIPGPRKSAETLGSIPHPIDPAVADDIQISNVCGKLIFDKGTHQFYFSPSPRKQFIETLMKPGKFPPPRIELYFNSGREFVDQVEYDYKFPPAEFIRCARDALPPICRNSQLVLRMPWEFTYGPRQKRQLIAAVYKLAVADDRPITVVSSGSKTNNAMRVWPWNDQPLFRLSHHIDQTYWTEVPGGIVLSKDPLSMTECRKFSDYFDNTDRGFTIYIENLALLEGSAEREVKHSKWMLDLSSGEPGLERIKTAIEIANFSAPLIKTSVNFYDATKTITVEGPRLTAEKLTESAQTLIDFTNQLAANGIPMRLRCAVKSKDGRTDALTLHGRAIPSKGLGSYQYGLFEGGDRHGMPKAVRTWNGVIKLLQQRE